MSENERNVDVTDTESVASTRSKPSGIKAPTVSRLCQHSARKPSIPTTPDTKSECTDNLTMRSNEDFTKLTDVDEETETDLARDRKYSRVSKSKSPESWRSKSTDRKVSNGSLGSDLYWEATGRRRSSDQGVVLTHDTDSFIIGQRVWVGGIRSGQIAYIGDTHFAPGEWAGVVLDEPNGKNDGCVSGKRYFQCEAKRGIFSRLTRLTREPLSGGAGGGDDTFNRSMTTSPVRSGTVSPVPSSYSAYQNMSTPRKSSSKANMVVGDRVIVSSGFGSRPGILKYLGETQFAPGTWCGVMLDDPTGKNDGAVDGIRYFECPDKYGIFVPLAKVTLSPSSRKTPSRLSRANSKESLTSIGTLGSMASTTVTSRMRISSAQKLTASARKPLTTPKNSFSLQEVLKEKQNHIEQLLTEKDLDRTEAANQATLFQKDINELHDKVQILEASLQDAQKKNHQLQTAMEEIQFCNEELTIQAEELSEKRTMIGDGLAPVAQTQQQPDTKKLEELEKLREELALKTLANDELEKSNAAIKEEISELHFKLTELQNSLAHNISADQSLNDEVGYLKLENETLRAELFGKDEALEKQFLAMRDIENTLQLKISELEEKLEQMKAIATKDTDSNIKLLDQVNEYTTMVLNKDQEILSITNDHLAAQQDYLGIIEDLKTQLKEKEGINQEVVSKNEKQLEDITKLTEDIKALEANYGQREEELKKAISDLANKSKEIDELKRQSSENNSRAEDLKKELDDIRETYKKQLAEGSDLGKVVESQNVQITELKNEKTTLEKKTEEISARLTSLESERESISLQLSVRLEELAKLTELVESLNKEIVEWRAKHSASLSEIESLKSKQNELSTELQTSHLAHDKAQKELSIEIEGLKSEIQSSAEKIIATVNERDNLANKLTDLEMLIETKSKDIELLNASQIDFIATIDSKEDHLQRLKKEFVDIGQQLEEAKNSSIVLEVNLGQLNVEKEHLKTELAAATEKVHQLEVQKKTLQSELEESRQSTNDDMLVRLNEELQAKQSELEKSLASWSESRITFEKTKTELIQQINNYTSQIERLREQMESITTQKASTENELNVEIAKIKASNEELKRQHEESVKALQNKFKTDKANVIEEITKKLEESEKRKAELNASLVNLEKMVSNLQSDLEAQQVGMIGKEKQFEEIKTKLERSAEEVLENNKKLIENKNALEKQVEALKASSESTNEAGQKRLAELIGELEKRNSELNEKSNLLAGKDSEIVNLKGELRKFEDVSREGQKRLDELEAGRKEFLAKVATLENSLLASENKLKESEIEVEKKLKEASEEKIALAKKLDDLLKGSSQSISEQQKEFENKISEINAASLLKIEKANSEKEELSQKLNDSIQELAKLKDQFATLTSDIKEKDNQLKNVQMELQSLTTKEAELTNLLKKFENLTLENKKKDDELAQFKQRIEASETILRQKDGEVQSLSNNLSELQLKLQSALAAKEGTISETLELKSRESSLQSSLESFEVLLKERDSKIEEVTKEKELLLSEADMLQITVSRQSDTIREMEKLDSEWIRREAKLKSVVDSLELELADMRATGKLKAQSVEAPNHNSKVTEEPMDFSDDSSAQIDFLNSIIADMQKKNENLIARVQVLESTPKEMPFAGVDQKVKRKPAPRIFCDICDIFDDHETENCPVQSDSPPASLLPAGAVGDTPKHDSEKPRVIPPPRKYCTNCESFGHEQDECDIADCF